ncbi:MAG TPA: hypothetical protein VG896_01610 [Candidatus Nitrosotalea sp.]|nr:hypothetical protein [Candidatus Nitrosotalea sp.]
MSEFVRCFQCGEPVLVDFQSFAEIKCSNCLFEIEKRLLTWCKCSHAGVDHLDTFLWERCRLCDCINFLHVQDHVIDEYDKKLR